jgi:hypothetical protein
MRNATTRSQTEGTASPSAENEVNELLPMMSEAGRKLAQRTGEMKDPYAGDRIESHAWDRKFSDSHPYDLLRNKRARDSRPKFGKG